MPTFEKPQFGTEYRGINCERCGHLVVFADEADDLPEPFQMRCHKCSHMGEYAKQSLLSVQAVRKH
jgi:hypothetical protein